MENMTRDRRPGTEGQNSKMFFFFWSLVSCLLSLVPCLEAIASEIPQVTEIKPSEIEDETHSRVIIREHPKTGKSYVSIVSSEAPVPEDPFTHQRNRYLRPDYRMLDPKAKKGDYQYDGPYSDRTKVYIFGATLIAGGITGGALGMAAAPAATGAASAGGGGAYLIGAGVATGAGGMTLAEMTKPKPGDENFTQESESKTVTSKEKT